LLGSHLGRPRSQALKQIGDVTRNGSDEDRADAEEMHIVGRQRGMRRKLGAPFAISFCVDALFQWTASSFRLKVDIRLGWAWSPNETRLSAKSCIATASGAMALSRLRKPGPAARHNVPDQRRTGHRAAFVQ
jgi:hypothetical protein